MDSADLIVQAIVGVTSAAAGVTVAAWKLSRDIERIRGEAAEARKKVDKVETDFDAHLKAEQEAWNETANQLGRIQGALDVSPPPRRSRPG